MVYLCNNRKLWLLSIFPQCSTNDTIPIMLVGNKVDLRDRAMLEGQKCIPTNYGEKLAMVRNTLCELLKALF